MDDFSGRNDDIFSSRGSFSQYRKITLAAVLLGVASVIAALLITYFSYRQASKDAERQYYKSYLKTARMLVACIDLPHERPLSDKALLHNMLEHWVVNKECMPSDEYMCVVNDKGELLLHTLSPETVGNNVADNLLVDEQMRPICRLGDISKAEQQHNRVGGYISSSGHEQIAAFAFDPLRKWIVGVHRSKEAVEREARAGFWPLLIALFVIGGVLIPISLFLLCLTSCFSQKNQKRIELALRESEGRYRIFFQKSIDGMLILDKDKIIDCNDASLKILGYKNKEDLQNLHPWEISPEKQPGGEKSLEKAEKIIALTLKNGSSRFEWVHKKANGELLPVEISITVVPEPHQEGKKLLHTVWRDITERKKAEEELKKLEEVVRLSPAVAFLWKNTEDWPVEYVSRNAKDLFGYPVEEFMSGQVNYADIIHPEDVLSVKEALKSCIEQGKLEFIFKYRVITKDKKIKWLEERSRIRKNTEGQITHFQGVILDITEKEQARQTLFESEHRFRELFNNMSSGVTIYNVIQQEDKRLAFAFVDINRAGEKISQTSKEQLIGLGAKDAFPEIFDQKLLEEFERVWKTGNAELLPASMYTRKKHPCWIEHYVYKLPAGQIVSVYDDVTERKQVEEALQKSEETHRGLLRRLSEAVYRMSIPEGVYEYFSPAAKDVFGYSPEDFLNNPMFIGKVIHPDFKVYFAEAWQNILKGEVASTYEYKILDNNGCARWISQTNTGIFDKAGNIIAIEACCTNITKQKNAQKELERTKSYLDNIIDSMPSLLIGVDSDGRITQWNNSAEKETGLPFGKASGHSIDEILPYMSDKMEEIHEAIRKREPLKEQRIVRHIDGELYYSDIMIYPLVQNGGNGAVVRVDDVTERVRLENMMIQTEKMMSVGGLAAGMAHEINNPLGVIMQGSENVLRRISPALPSNKKTAAECGLDFEKMDKYLEKRKIKEFVEDVRKAAARASKIVKNMLQFSRRSESYMSSCDISEIIDASIELASNDYDLKKKYDFRHIKIERNYAPDINEIFCIESELKQVLLNLLKNAAQSISSKEYSDEETPRIAIRTLNDHDFVKIEVEDNGLGMGENTRKRIFEPFFTTKQVGIGTGLGLSVSYFIITENHKGTMGVTASPGGGAIFTIRIPKKQEKEQ